MRFSFFIALRYLLAKKGNNIINWITRISVTVVCIVSAALVIILSAMNGLSSSVMDLYSDFDPDIKIQAAEGKRMQMDSLTKAKIESVDGVNLVVESIEETVLLKYRDRQEVATLKGVDSKFDSLNNIEGSMIDGFYALYGNGQEMCVLGTDMALKLGVNVDLMESIFIYIPSFEGKGIGSEFFKFSSAKPVGVFDITSDFNAKYLLTRKELANDLLKLDGQINSLEIGLKHGVDANDVKMKLKELLGDQFQVKTRFEQNEFLFRSINAEKWITLLILSLVVILAVFNVVGSLTILIIDKSHDIYVLKSMGASSPLIKFIFWLEGFIISGFGSLLGLFIGWLACFLQEKFCYFGYGVAGKIDCFPTETRFADFIIVFFMVNGIAVITSLAPILKLNKKLL